MHPSTTASTRTWKALGATIAVTLVAGIAPVAAAASTHHGSGGTGFSVVATGLDNPRGLAFRSNGQLVVGEAGHAGSKACFAGNPEDPTGQTCIGFTSQISTIDVRTGAHSPIVKGLVSIGDGPIATTGIDGVSTRGNRVFGIITGAPQGAPPAAACAGDTTCVKLLAKAKKQVGKLIQVTRGGGWKWVASVGKYNYDWIVDNHIDPANPDFQPGDSNPYGIASTRAGTYAVDGGSNTLDLVSPDGRIKVLAYLPNPPGPADQRFPYDAVPTCVAPTEHGVVVGDLSGRLWNWSHGKLTQIKVPDGMLHSVNGCTVDSAGNIFAVDMFVGFDPQFGFAPNTGSVVEVEHSGKAEVVTTGLNLPGGIAIGRHGAIYVSNNAVCPADVTGLPPQLCASSGEVVRLDHRADD